MNYLIKEYEKKKKTIQTNYYYPQQKLNEERKQ